MRVSASVPALVARRPRTQDAAAVEVNGGAAPGLLGLIVLPSESEHDGLAAIVYSRGCDVVVEAAAAASPTTRQPREGGGGGGLGARGRHRRRRCGACRCVWRLLGYVAMAGRVGGGEGRGGPPAVGLWGWIQTLRSVEAVVARLP